MPCCAIASDLPPVWIEVGPTAMHYTPDKIDANTGMYHVSTTPADHGLAATGGRLRMMVALLDGWYFGVEATSRTSTVRHSPVSGSRAVAER